MPRLHRSLRGHGASAQVATAQHHCRRHAAAAAAALPASHTSILRRSAVPSPPPFSPSTYSTSASTATKCMPPSMLPSRRASVAASASSSSSAGEKDKEAKKVAKKLEKEAKKAQKRALAAASKKRRDDDDGDEESGADDDDADFPLSLEATVAARAAATAAPSENHRASAFVHDAVPSSSPAATSQHYSREDALWDRSDALWRREMARWDAERRAWDEREAALLATVGTLQREVGRLSAMLPSASSSSVSPSSSAATQHAAQVFVPPAPAPAPVAPPSPPAAPAAAPAASATAADDHNNGYLPASGVSFAEHLAAAVAAVSTGDVLEDALGGHGELLARGAAALGLEEKKVEDKEQEQEQPPLASAAAAAASAQSKAAAAAAAAAAPPSSTDLPPLPPLPVLIEGSDDLFWVNALQALLDSHAMHCGDEEAEDFYFGGRTRAALETFQACEGLPETGVCDEDTWLKLVRGDAGKLRELRLRAPTEADVEAAVLATTAAAATTGAPFASSSSSPPAAASPAVETFTALSSSSSHTHTHTLRVDADGEGHLKVTEEDEDREETTVVVAAATPPPPASSTSTSAKPPRAAWPILREGDGGREVHALQVALDRAGMHCGDEDEQWWQFGDSTHAALVTFQACSGLPESGVVDERTWRSLLVSAAKKDAPGGAARDPSSFSPGDVDSLTSGDANDDDMLGNHRTGMVFLLGEQRWERKREVS